MKSRLLKRIYVRLFIILAMIFFSIITLIRVKTESKRWIDTDVTIKLPLEIEVLSTGKSDFIFIDIQGKFIVIDAGFYENSTKIYDFLKFKGVEELEYFILSHNDKDHIGGAPIILDNFKVKNLIQADYEKATNHYKSYVESLERNDIKPILLHENMYININGVSIKIYPASNKKYEKSNDYCIIVGIKYENYSFLFAADAEDERMREFIESDTGKYTFLKMAHHGIYNNLVEEFLESVSPDYAVITCSRFMYPTTQMLDLLDKYKIRTFYTSNGDISIKCDGNNIYFVQD